MMYEIWKIIPSTDSYYEVSDHGRVRRAKPGRATHVGKIVRGSVDRKGYHRVPMSFNGNHLKKRVHRLVLLAFEDMETPADYQVNHKDGNKLNNHVENLEYCTQSENMLHAYKNGLKVSIGCPKITQIQVDKIRLLYKSGDISQRELARKFKITQAQVWNIVNYKHWNKSKSRTGNPITRELVGASGYRGVHKNGKRWSARVIHNGVTYNVGTFNTPLLASEACEEKKREIYSVED